MDSIMAFLSNPLVVMAVQLGVGWVVKNKTATVNKAIPLINYVIGVLIQLPGVAFQPGGVAPTSYASISFVSGIGALLSNPLFSSLIYTLLSTGTHSTTKNLMQMMKPNAAA